MKENKSVRGKPWSLGNVHTPRGATHKGSCKLIVPIMVGLLTLAVLRSGLGYFAEVSISDSDDLFEIRAYEKAVASKSVKLLSSRNASFSFLPKINNWDLQRQVWLKANPDVRAGRPKVLLITGSQPGPCQRPIDTHLYLRTAKNKIHYCRIHDIQMNYNLMEPDAELNGSWEKLPVIRMQMLAHPEVEWFWWVDSDAVFTDMHSELALEEFQNYYLVLQGDANRVHAVKDSKGLITGNFLIRNCQWSLHFLDAWASMGPARTREDVGKFLSSSLKGRPVGTADDQSALVYLLVKEKKLWDSKVHLQKELFFTGVFTDVTDKLEEMAHGDSRLPLVTYFGGCSQCAGDSGALPRDTCRQELERAMDFADNQVYRKFGYQLRKLGSSELVPIPGYTLETVVGAVSPGLSEQLEPELHGFPFHKLPGPKVTDWDSQRNAWFRNDPSVTRKNEYGRSKMMIVTGSSPRECSRPIGSHLLLRALKNKVDYARFHDLEFFYGMADFDSQLNDWWTKIPTIRMLMLTRPDVEWFWWCDGDAIVTDMVFDIKFEDYVGQNLLLYGNKDLVAVRDWIAINAGVYLIRNCQWSLDLFDVWASYGTKAVRLDSGRMVSKVLMGRAPNDEADDQSALLYLLVTDQQKLWGPKICLERSVTISGYWKIITNRFDEMKKISHPGLGNMDWPWITHFAGCQPCGAKMGNFPLEECLHEMARAFDFADDQILQLYGLQHSVLGFPAVKSIKP